ncbi:MAG: hypothetical protein RR356_00570 [Bacteroidales bacterium]
MIMCPDSFSLFQTKEEIFDIEELRRQSSVAFVKDLNPVPELVLATPEFVKQLVEKNVRVWIQRKYAVHTSYTDLDYADVGAEIVDDFHTMAQLSDLLVKFSPFTIEETQMMKDRQIIISYLAIPQITKEFFEIFEKKKITAIATNFIKDRNDQNIIEVILTEIMDKQAVNIALGAFMMPIVNAIVYHQNIRNSIQTNPALLQGVYCYKGILCSKSIADRLNLMWKDILSLCWDLN